MDLSQRAIQTNEKHLSNFKLVFEMLAENRKFWQKKKNKKKTFKRIARRDY